MHVDNYTVRVLFLCFLFSSSVDPVAVDDQYRYTTLAAAVHWHTSFRYASPLLSFQSAATCSDSTHQAPLYLKDVLHYIHGMLFTCMYLLSL